MSPVSTDSMFDGDVTVVQIRQTLAAPDYSHTVQPVERNSELASFMGPYMPKSFYTQPNQAEMVFTCKDPRYIWPMASAPRMIMRN